MNILFCFEGAFIPHRGGIGRVTEVFADFFETRGHRCYYLARTERDKEWSRSPRQFYLPIPDDAPVTHKENCDFFDKFLEDNKIHVVIDQCMGLLNQFQFPEICAARKVPVLSVLHNDPLAFARKFQTMRWSGTFLTRRYRKLKYYIKVLRWKYLFTKVYKREYALCKKNVLLSELFRAPFSKLVGDGEKVTVIPNPLPPDMGGVYEKKKTLLYVGRLENSQKQVDLLLGAWQRLCDRFPEWELLITGDGPDGEKLRQMAGKNNLKNIRFTGYADPVPYYKEAAIFCMTSLYEGFGMVLIEASSFGCVPVCFNFIPSEDLVEHEKNAFIVKQGDVEKYAETLERLMSHSEILPPLGEAARQNAQRFSIENIGQQWLKLLEECVNDVGPHRTRDGFRPAFIAAPTNISGVGSTNDAPTSAPVSCPLETARNQKFHGMSS
jgi:glycosyltransferase involved in cell wall biosynthesis